MYAHTLYEGGCLDLKKEARLHLLTSEISNQDVGGSGEVTHR